jgi:hypothetical protein
MSFTSDLSHGVYEIETPVLPLIKGYFAAFQCWEFASGVVATPRSPIELARESGAIVKNGTVVWIEFKAPSTLLVT